MRTARHIEHGLQGVERTGADIAKHHAKGGQAQRSQARVSWSGLKRLARLVWHGVTL
jgi:hypothetical protein